MGTLARPLNVRQECPTYKFNCRILLLVNGIVREGEAPAEPAQRAIRKLSGSFALPKELECEDPLSAETLFPNPINLLKF